jgi:predicted nuclease of predicted toxin-antitoxin system
LLTQLGEDDALQAVRIMSLGLLADLTQETTVNAAHISYELQIAMADSIILATTRLSRYLVTQDADFEEMEGVQYIKKLPD